MYFIRVYNNGNIVKATHIYSSDITAVASSAAAVCCVLSVICI